MNVRDWTRVISSVHPSTITEPQPQHPPPSPPSRCRCCRRASGVTTVGSLPTDMNGTTNHPTLAMSPLFSKWLFLSILVAIIHSVDSSAFVPNRIIRVQSNSNTVNYDRSVGSVRQWQNRFSAATDRAYSSSSSSSSPTTPETTPSAVVVPPNQPFPDTDDGELSIVSFNILAPFYHWIGHENKDAHVEQDRLERVPKAIDMAKQSNADVLCLQEVEGGSLELETRLEEELLKPTKDGAVLGYDRFTWSPLHPNRQGDVVGLAVAWRSSKHVVSVVFGHPVLQDCTVLQQVVSI